MGKKRQQLICACGCRRAFTPSHARQVYYERSCKYRAFRNRHKAGRLRIDNAATIPEEKFRDLLRKACLARWPEGGRLKLRFGPYHPNK